MKILTKEELTILQSINEMLALYALNMRRFEDYPDYQQFASRQRYRLLKDRYAILNYGGKRC